MIRNLVVVGLQYLRPLFKKLTTTSLVVSAMIFKYLMFLNLYGTAPYFKILDESII